MKVVQRCTKEGQHSHLDVTSAVEVVILSLLKQYSQRSSTMLFVERSWSRAVTSRGRCQACFLCQADLAFRLWVAAWLFDARVSIALWYQHWWFPTWFIYPNIRVVGFDTLIVFRRVETTNQSIQRRSHDIWHAFGIPSFIDLPLPSFASN